jgi:hypothetical protein
MILGVTMVSEVYRRPADSARVLMHTTSERYPRIHRRPIMRRRATVAARPPEWSR